MDQMQGAVCAPLLLTMLCGKRGLEYAGPSFRDGTDAKPSTRAADGMLYQDRVWALEDLEVLHHVDRPLLICKLGQKGDPAR